jgi:hypothetical protein
MLHYTKAHTWIGGDPSTLYAVIDKRTGRTIVRPPDQMGGVGPDVDVRVATRAEAEEHWQRPLHAGWRVAPCAS